MKETEEQQLFFIRWAIQLAEKGRCTAPPNPWVGCVIVKEGGIIAEGYHVAPGLAHAEVVALEKAGILAKGATAYVNLEPCCHYGRTPPCVNALVKAGIRKVVIALLDPDPRVSGKGVEGLRQAGIEVTVGVGMEEAAKSLAPYLHQRKLGRPFVVLKAAVSLDGKTAAVDGSSQWITGETARTDVKLLRAQSQAILVGAGTALADRPRLTVRGVEIRKQPLRVLLDSQGKVPAEGPLADITLAPTLVFTNSKTAKEKWEQCGAEVMPPLSLKEMLEELGKRGVLQALVEGGSHLHTSFVQEGLANRFILYMGNCLLGPKGMPLLSGMEVSSIGEAPRWTLDGVQRFENDVRLDYRKESGLW